MIQKSCRLFENPPYTVGKFVVVGRILRSDHQQLCLSTTDHYQSLSQSIAESNFQASFSISRNRILQLLFHEHSTTSEAISFSCFKIAGNLLS